MTHTLRILLIDDNPDDRTLVMHELGREFPDLQVEEIAEVQGLARALDAGGFDLVITDYELRWTDGLTVLHAIKARWSDCPVIMFTATGSEEIAVEAMKAGLDDYVLKSPKHYVRLVAAVRAVLERAETHRRAAGLETRLNTLLNRLQVGVFRSTLDGCLLEANPAFLRLFGLQSLQEAQTTALDELYLRPEDRLQLLNQLKETGYVHEYEMQLRRADGSPFWVSLTEILGTTLDGTTVIDGLVEDINKRKRAEEALRRSEEYFRSLIENALDIITILAGDGTVRYESPSTERVLGYKPEDLTGKNVFEFIHPDDVPHVMHALTDTFQKPGIARSAVFRFRHKDDSWRILESIGKSLPDDSGVAVVVNSRDITARKRVEEELRTRACQQAAVADLGQRALAGTHLSLLMDAAATLVARTLNVEYCEVLETLPDGNALLLRAGVGWNEGCVGSVTVDTGTASQAGYTLLFREPVIVDDLHAETRFSGPSLLHDHGVVSGVSVLIPGTSRPFGVLGAHTTRRRRFMEDDVHFLEAVANVLAGAIVHQRLEEQLRQTQKLEAIGTLAGGIAHDFNNILTAILGFTELALYDVPQDSAAWCNLQEAFTAGKRAKDLVQQILAFSRQSKQEYKPVQLHLIVKEALTLLRASLPATINIRQHIAPRAGTVLADPTQMHQVLMNLCTNAEHAMRETGGVLEVRLEAVEVDADFAAVHPELTPGPHLRLTVRDTGYGMKHEVMERIFEPFFTTKDLGEGTGMGLAVIHGIITSHGGAITVASAPGHGTTFEVYLPRIDRTAGPEARPEEAIPGGHERILFVDDEDALARLGQALLERLGYEITVRTSSIEALEVFRVAPQRFDLVITDQTMPNMTGEVLARELRRIRPDIPIILCTGFSYMMTAEKAQTLGIDAFLMKPLVTRDLGLAIRQVLDSRQQRRLDTPSHDAV
jgi:PAS domain S-box-containing protein